MEGFVRVSAIGFNEEEVMTEQSKGKKQVPIWLQSEAEKAKITQQKVIQAEEKRKVSKLPLGLGWMCKCWRLSFVFNGRARRREYWLFYVWELISYCVLPYFVLHFVLYMVIAVRVIGGGIGTTDSNIADTIADTAGVLTILIFLFPLTAVFVRRMHDTGRSGLWMFVPIVSLIFLLQDSQKRTNKYGENPKGIM